MSLYNQRFSVTFKVNCHLINLRIEQQVTSLYFYSLCTVIKSNREDSTSRLLLNIGNNTANTI